MNNHIKTFLAINFDHVFISKVKQKEIYNPW